jgi:serine/threonine protein kinase
MDEPAKSLIAGSIFARDFRITHRLGEGGMGVIYAAEQISTSKPRALKVMHPTMVHDTRLRDRFLQEAHAAAQIESDHVAEVVAAGVDEATGAPWLAMELLRGQTLEQRVTSSGPFGPRELLELSTQMRHVLAQAHARGLVHRDIKPENLFIAQPRRVGIPFMLKVLDFGIAKWLQETRSVGNSQVIGSPLWMAPEQWQPNAPIGPQTDVWAVALVMFFALAGRAYWRSADSDDISRIIVEVVSAPLAPPTERARELGSSAQVPAGFDDWFLACLSRQPAQRPPNGDAALARFEELFEGARSGPQSVHFRSVPSPAPPPVATSSSSVVPAPVVPAPAVTPISPRVKIDTDDRTRALHEVTAAPALTGVVWAHASSPLGAHARVQRVLTALVPALDEALSVDPVLVGLTADLRLDRLAARATAERAAYDQAAAALTEVATRFGLEHPALYARPGQEEPLRVEPTTPLSSVLGPSIAQVTRAATIFLCAMAAAAGKPELRLRAIVPDIMQLRRIVSAATDIARGSATKGPRDMVTSVLREHVVAGSDLAACLDADGDACTEPALAAWLVAADCTLARIGLLASGRLAAAAEALAAPPPMVVPAAVDAVLADLSAWTAGAGYAEARAMWGAPLA